MSSDALTPKDITHWTEVTLRFSDQDALGHVNNTKYPQFFEAGRVELIRAMMARFGITTRSILASAKIDYLRQLHYPGVVRTGTKLMSLGRSSYVLEQVLQRDDDPETMIARCSSVMVFFDYKINQKAPVPDNLRDAFDQRQPIP